MGIVSLHGNRKAKFRPKDIFQTLVSEYSQAGHLSSVILSFLICKLRMRILPFGCGRGNQPYYIKSMTEPLIYKRCSINHRTIMYIKVLGKV